VPLTWGQRPGAAESHRHGKGGGRGHIRLHHV
jgi:hypothetical protein